MNYVLVFILFVFIVLPILFSIAKLKEDDINRPYTHVTIYMGTSVVMSTLLSIIIALNANISPSSGHGGFIYIFGPGVSGIAIVTLHVVFVKIIPKLKFTLGLISIYINIAVGFMFYLN